jgi:hypothetical protein
MFVARRVDSRVCLLAGMGMKKNGREITKLALSVSFFFHSSGVFVSSNQICIYYDSSRFALLWLSSFALL